MTNPIVIIGAGQAGLQTAESLRADGFEGGILLIGEEPVPPYSRPPLSKAFLLGQAQEAQLFLRGLPALNRKGIEFVSNIRVVSIDRRARRIALSDGRLIPYSGLVIATGARSRELSVPGGRLDGVLSLRTLEDARNLSRWTASAERIIVIGGGFVGLEFAAVATKLGKRVTILETGSRLMARAVSQRISEWALELHKSHGVEILLNARVNEIVEKAGRACGVATAAGEHLTADLIVAAVGAMPNDALAADAGIETDRGVVVDICGRTSDDMIVAVGDCTVTRLPNGEMRRLESVFNAVEQGKAAAAALMHRHRPFVGTPWFWTDQYEAKLQMTGTSLGHTSIIERKAEESGSFSLFYYQDQKLIGADSINRPQDHVHARKLLDLGISPNRKLVANPRFDLASLVSANTSPARRPS